MKIKDVEGDAHEIANFFQQHNFNLNEYLNIKKEKKPVPTYVLIIIILAFFANACFVFIHTFTPPIHDILVLLLFLISGGCVVIIHYNLENKIVTFLNSCVFITIVSVCLGVKSPSQAVKDAAKATKGVSDKVLE